MISLQLLNQAILESKNFDQNLSIKRDNYFDVLKEASKNKLIKAIVGFRRSGKSHLLKMLSHELQKEGVLSKNIFFLNFENDLLNEIKTVRELRILWEMYLVNIANPKEDIYIIWDEIQLVDKWEKLVRTLYEQGKYNIFISGSNSKLLSGEFSTSLSGRCLEFEILPFSFMEFLEKSNINHNNYYENREEIDIAFNLYLKRGGLPEQFDLDDDSSKKYIDNIIQKILIDDIVKRYGVEKINTLKEVFDFVKGNITSTTSLRKISERIKNQGIKVSLATVDNYLYYWQTSYSLNKLSKFDYQLKRIFEKSNKYYCVDNLLIPGGDESDEKRLENLVYCELIRRYGRKNIYYAQNENGYEIDFLVNQDNKKSFFQICYTLNDGNSKREFGNLKIINNYIKGTGKLLYLNDQRTNFKENGAVSVIEWLLE
ncbi:MAG: ATPase [uncultured bacterium]|nr:MAG: ATPase [uncultured bacterium]